MNDDDLLEPGSMRDDEDDFDGPKKIPLLDDDVESLDSLIDADLADEEESEPEW